MKTKVGRTLIDRVAEIFDKEAGQMASLFIKVDTIRDGVVFLDVQTRNKRGVVLTSLPLPGIERGSSVELEDVNSLFKIEITVN